jgi:putative transposase
MPGDSDQRASSKAAALAVQRPPLGGLPETHQRSLRAGRLSEEFAVYSVTKCVDHRRRVLANPAAAAIVIASLRHVREQQKIKLLSFCVMPDHYHVLVLLLPGQSLSQAMNGIGKFTALQINKLISASGRFWQEGFFDHRCRSIDDMLDRMEYIEYNPVRAGLVKTAEDWLFSSAHPSHAHLLDRHWYAEACL